MPTYKIENDQPLEIEIQIRHTYQPFASTKNPGIEIGANVGYYEEAIIKNGKETYRLNLLTADGREELDRLQTKLKKIT